VTHGTSFRFAGRHSSCAQRCLLAIERVRAQDAGRAQQIDRILADTDRTEVGMFAAACCQRQALQLKPWQIPLAGFAIQITPTGVVIGDTGKLMDLTTRRDCYGRCMI
jgi:hypothetical protein